MLRRTVYLPLSLIAHAALMALTVSQGGTSRTPSHEETIISVTWVTDPVATTPPEPQVVSPHVAGGLSHKHPYPVRAGNDTLPRDPAPRHEASPPLADPAPADSPIVAAPPRPSFVVAWPGSSGRSRDDSGAPSAAASAASGKTGSPVDGAHQGGGDSIVSEARVTERARLLSASPAAYPAEARAAEIEADVVLEIVVGSNGRVLSARVVRGAGDGLDEAALAAIKRYAFSPAKIAGAAVAVRMPWVVQFRLR